MVSQYSGRLRGRFENVSKGPEDSDIIGARLREIPILVTQSTAALQLPCPFSNGRSLSKGEHLPPDPAESQLDPRRKSQRAFGRWPVRRRARLNSSLGIGSRIVATRRYQRAETARSWLKAKSLVGQVKPAQDLHRFLAMASCMAYFRRWRNSVYFCGNEEKGMQLGHWLEQNNISWPYRSRKKTDQGYEQPGLPTAAALPVSRRSDLSFIVGETEDAKARPRRRGFKGQGGGEDEGPLCPSDNGMDKKDKKPWGSAWYVWAVAKSASPEPTLAPERRQSRPGQRERKTPAVASGARPPKARQSLVGPSPRASWLQHAASLQQQLTWQDSIDLQQMGDEQLQYANRLGKEFQVTRLPRLRKRENGNSYSNLLAAPPTPNSLTCNPNTLAGNPNTLAGNPNTLAYKPNTLAGTPNTLAGNPNTLTCNPNTLAGNPNTLAGNPNTLAGTPAPPESEVLSYLERYKDWKSLPPDALGDPPTSDDEQEGGSMFDDSDDGQGQSLPPALCTRRQRRMSTPQLEFSASEEAAVKAGVSNSAVLVENREPQTPFVPASAQVEVIAELEPGSSQADCSSERKQELLQQLKHLATFRKRNATMEGHSSAPPTSKNMALGASHIPVSEPVASPAVSLHSTFRKRNATMEGHSSAPPTSKKMALGAGHIPVSEPVASPAVSLPLSAPSSARLEHSDALAYHPLVAPVVRSWHLKQQPQRMLEMSVMLDGQLFFGCLVPAAVTPSLPSAPVEASAAGPGIPRHLQAALSQGQPLYHPLLGSSPDGLATRGFAPFVKPAPGKAIGATPTDTALAAATKLPHTSLAASSKLVYPSQPLAQVLCAGSPLSLGGPAGISSCTATPSTAAAAPSTATPGHQAQPEHSPSSAPAAPAALLSASDEHSNPSQLSQAISLDAYPARLSSLPSPPAGTRLAVQPTSSHLPSPVQPPTSLLAPDVTAASAAAPSPLPTSSAGGGGVNMAGGAAPTPAHAEETATLASMSAWQPRPGFVMDPEGAPRLASDRSPTSTSNEAVASMLHQGWSIRGPSLHASHMPQRASYGIVDTSGPQYSHHLRTSSQPGTVSPPLDKPIVRNVTTAVVAPTSPQHHQPGSFIPSPHPGSHISSLYPGSHISSLHPGSHISSLAQGSHISSPNPVSDIPSLAQGSHITSVQQGAHISSLQQGLDISSRLEGDLARGDVLSSPHLMHQRNPVTAPATQVSSSMLLPHLDTPQLLPSSPQFAPTHANTTLHPHSDTPQLLPSSPQFAPTHANTTLHPHSDMQRKQPSADQHSLDSSSQHQRDQTDAATQSLLASGGSNPGSRRTHQQVELPDPKRCLITSPGSGPAFAHMELSPVFSLAQAEFPQASRQEPGDAGGGQEFLCVGTTLEGTACGEPGGGGDIGSGQKDISCAPGFEEEPKQQLQLQPTTTNQLQLQPTTTNQLQLQPTTTNQLQLRPTTTNQLQLEPTTTNQLQLQPTTTNQLQLQPTTTNQLQLQPTTANQLQLQPTTPNQLQLQPTTTNQPELEMHHASAQQQLQQLRELKYGEDPSHSKLISMYVPANAADSPGSGSEGVGGFGSSLKETHGSTTPTFGRQPEQQRFHSSQQQKHDSKSEGVGGFGSCLKEPHGSTTPTFGRESNQQRFHSSQHQRHASESEGVGGFGSCLKEPHGSTTPTFGRQPEQQRFHSSQHQKHDSESGGVGGFGSCLKDGSATLTLGGQPNQQRFHSPQLQKHDSESEGVGGFGSCLKEPHGSTTPIFGGQSGQLKFHSIQHLQKEQDLAKADDSSHFKFGSVPDGANSPMLEAGELADVGSSKRESSTASLSEQPNQQKQQQQDLRNAQDCSHFKFGSVVEPARANGQEAARSPSPRSFSGPVSSPGINDPPSAHAATGLFEYTAPSIHAQSHPSSTQAAALILTHPQPPGGDQQLATFAHTQAHSQAQWGPSIMPRPNFPLATFGSIQNPSDWLPGSTRPLTFPSLALGALDNTPSSFAAAATTKSMPPRTMNLDFLAGMPGVDSLVEFQVEAEHQLTLSKAATRAAEDDKTPYVRCAICKIRRKGRCGTPIASKGCLKKSSRPTCGTPSASKDCLKRAPDQPGSPQPVWQPPISLAAPDQSGRISPSASPSPFAPLSAGPSALPAYPTIWRPWAPPSTLAPHTAQHQHQQSSATHCPFPSTSQAAHHASLASDPPQGELPYRMAAHTLPQRPPPQITLPMEVGADLSSQLALTQEMNPALWHGLSSDITAPSAQSYGSPSLRTDGSGAETKPPSSDSPCPPAPGLAFPGQGDAGASGVEPSQLPFPGQLEGHLPWPEPSLSPGALQGNTSSLGADFFFPSGATLPGPDTAHLLGHSWGLPPPHMNPLAHSWCDALPPLGQASTPCDPLSAAPGAGMNNPAALLMQLKHLSALNGSQGMPSSSDQGLLVADFKMEQARQAEHARLREVRQHYVKQPPRLETVQNYVIKYPWFQLLNGKTSARGHARGLCRLCLIHCPGSSKWGDGNGDGVVVRTAADLGFHQRSALHMKAAEDQGEGGPYALQHDMDIQRLSPTPPHGGDDDSNGVVVRTAADLGFHWRFALRMKATEMDQAWYGQVKPKALSYAPRKGGWQRQRVVVRTAAGLSSH
eukprot:gene21834-28862_t